MTICTCFLHCSTELQLGGEKALLETLKQEVEGCGFQD